MAQAVVFLPRTREFTGFNFSRMYTILTDVSRTECGDSAENQTKTTSLQIFANLSYTTNDFNSHKYRLMQLRFLSTALFIYLIM